jgi:hypothetical protein
MSEPSLYQSRNRLAVPSLKYKSKAVFWDLNKLIVISKQRADEYRFENNKKLPTHIVRFDSTHEFAVYLELSRIYGHRRIVRQYPLEIFPASVCYPKGKTWKVDFAIISSKPPFSFTNFVEAKGVMMREFRGTLACLEQNNFEAFEKLSMVFPRAIPTDCTLVKTLSRSEYRTMLLTLPELRQLNILP